MRILSFSLLGLFVLGLISCQKETIDTVPLETDQLIADNQQQYEELLQEYELTNQELTNLEVAKDRNHFPFFEVQEVNTFLPAGPEGGGLLIPGTFFPPTRNSRSVLRRSRSGLKIAVRTGGLPPGAYTAWWVVFGRPDNCQYELAQYDGACGGDLAELGNEKADISVFYSTGTIVREDGVGYFGDRHFVGNSLGIPGEQHIQGDGTFDARIAEVHYIIKYHGPVAKDYYTRKKQLTTILGSCSEGANSLDFGGDFGVQCFDPQVVVFPYRE